MSEPSEDVAGAGNVRSPIARSKTLRRLACLTMGTTAAIFMLRLNYVASHKGRSPTALQLLEWIGTTDGIVVGLILTVAVYWLLSRRFVR